MKNVKESLKTLNDYIKEAKFDMILYFIILGILVISQVVLYILYGIPVAIFFFISSFSSFTFYYW